ncbi:MAG: virulence RhuM family protein [Planctomycetes bacterium]|nr:virulence RhuM family protein [Planctomycetota bacterium]
MDPDTQGEIILYRTDDGRTEIELHTMDDNVWLTQNDIAQLFDTTRANVTTHIKNIYVDGELSPAETRKEYLPTPTGKFRKGVQLYSLHMILAIGFRVRSLRGLQFRQWAARNLSEYLVKGFVVNDERLKNPGGRDYFDELLARIRDIRASEKRFYQKVRDLFKLSMDYYDDPHATSIFFALAQNKLLFAVTGMTAAEIIVERADSAVPNMGLTAFKRDRVRKENVIVAKNYLNGEEIDELNRIVNLFLDQAELRARSRERPTMAFWRENLDRFLSFADKAILTNAGTVTHEKAIEVAHSVYMEFDDSRRAAEAREADAEDIAELENVERVLMRMEGENPVNKH